MAGERSERLVSIAARAAQRTANRVKIVNELYAPESPMAQLRDLSFEEWSNELIETGHRYDPNCTRPFCMKVKAMIAAGLSQLMQQPQV
jgi:hypothetical protein